MDLKNTPKRTLPPLVDGKIHGYLELTIDKIVWTQKSPEHILITAVWWGELDNAQFRFDALNGKDYKPKYFIETYAIKTNFNLFKEYLKNADNIKLSIGFGKSQHIIGTAYVKKLMNLFFCKSFTQCSPIFNNNGLKIGNVYVKITLIPMKKIKSLHSTTNSKIETSTIDKLTSNISATMPITNVQNVDFDNRKYDVNSFNELNNLPLMLKNIHENDNIYQSILRDKRSNFSIPASKSTMNITDKLVAEVVARARKLRSEITHNLTNQTTNYVDSLLIDENSISDSFCSDETVKKEIALYEYMVGKEMSIKSEKNALETLRTCSPTPILIDIATKTIELCNKKKIEALDKDKKMYHHRNYHSNYSEDALGSDTMNSLNKICLDRKVASPLDYIDSVKIIIDFLILSSAGYRRIKSSCISRGGGLPISVTYTVQYDTMFVNIKNLKNNNKRIFNRKKTVKMCSKRQEGLIVYFNHEQVYDLPKQYIHTDMPLKFKVFNRHIKQKTPTELGLGSMYISDASKSPFLTSTQKVAVVKKGIKTGELRVKIELGCDKIHFGRKFVEVITSAKENIPILESFSDSVNSKANSSHRYRTITGNESKSGSKGNFSSTKQDKIMPLSEKGKKNKNSPYQKSDELFFDIQFPDNSKGKILLYGLIYIGDGKELPEMSTYLICRAFWREDKSLSRICSGTDNPFYHFHQLVPLIHSPELLERTKDNCIITEVYSKHPENDDNDKLIGIVKLSVHKLYIALKDPLLLPHLLKSKYPIISVDGWVSIADPISGKLQGQLHALVALGTVDQISLLEMTRGIREPHVTAQISRNDGLKTVLNVGNNEISDENLDTHYSERFYQNKYKDGVQKKKSQECQTEITIVNDLKRQVNKELQPNGKKSTGLYTLIDRSVDTLTISQTNVNGEVPSSSDFSLDPRNHIKVYNVEPLCLDGLNGNSYSIESPNASPRDNFNMPREIFRSVGVGAEFDEEVDLTSNNAVYKAQDDGDVDKSSFHLDNNSRSLNDERRENSYSTETYLPLVENNPTNPQNGVVENGFKATIEIYWALHLPKTEKDNQFIDPCTYVTFRKFNDNTNTKTNAYMTTDVYPFSCNPKYEWRVDTKLSCDLLTKQDKKLIMKVRRLVNPNISMRGNIEEDIVIGSAILDLSCLIAGFPLISGWFNIIDSNGKCNGQLQVSVTPLDNIDIFKTSAAITSESVIINKPHNIRETIVSKDPACDVEPVIDLGFSFEDTSMSFLSQSLKQKLSELDEIKQRLQSRLQDVTNSAFDDYDNNFNIEDLDDDHEGNRKNDNEAVSIHDSVLWSSPLLDNQATNYIADTDRTTNENRYPNSDNDHDYSIQSSSENNTITIEGNLPDTGYSLNLNNHGSQQLTNENMNKDNKNHYCNNLKFTQIHYQKQYQGPDIKNHKNEETSVCNLNSNSSYLSTENQFNDTDYPIRGSRIHINHLLDKLSTQLASTPPPINYLPMKRNIMDLISSLRRNNNNNNIFRNVKCNREINVRTVPTQTDVNDSSDSRLNNTLNNTAYHERDNRKGELELPVKSQKRTKISSVIKDELISDDHNDSTEYDYLSTHLMTSNVRHIELDGMSPLFYTHMIPDILVSANNSVTLHPNAQQNPSHSSVSDKENVEILDNRYAKLFHATINKGLEKINDQRKIESTREIIAPNFQEFIENAEEFHIMPFGMSENTDRNIDITVIHKPCNDDLIPNNSYESITIATAATTTTLIDNNTQILSKIDDNSLLDSSETSAFVVSRPAPDGGNPNEDIDGCALLKPVDKSVDSSSTQS